MGAGYLEKAKGALWVWWEKLEAWECGKGIVVEDMSGLGDRAC
jgi:hypothetical protein